MQIEYEATYTNVNKNGVRERLRKAGAELVRPEYLQRRIPFDPPKDMNDKGTWVRVRDEGDKITLSWKSVTGTRIEDQQEICITVDDFDKAVELLEKIGCTGKSYQESKRELWMLDDVEVTIDEWPFLEPFVEVEGKDEASVRDVSEKLGFDYSKALFCAVGTLYKMKYGIHEDEINGTPRITFDDENPFIKSYTQL